MKKGNGFSNSYLIEQSNFNSIIPYEECVYIWNKARNDLKTDEAVKKIIKKLGLTYSQEKRKTIRDYFYKYKGEVK